MSTDFTFQTVAASGDVLPRPGFDAIICYENRAELRTSRWLFGQLSTAADGPTDQGWLWLSTTLEADALTVRLAGDPQGESLLASGSADISTPPTQVALSPADGQTLAGELWVESASRAVTGVPVLASLCVDDDLAQLWADLDQLGPDVVDPIFGLARYCAAATRRTLMLVAQLYPDRLGGVGPREDRRLSRCSRIFPDYRRIVAPDQLRHTAACWALEMALGSKHQASGASLYARLRDHFQAARKQAISDWSLSLTLDADAGSDAQAQARAAANHPTRL